MDRIAAEKSAKAERRRIRALKGRWPARDPKYRRWVASLACCVCGATPAEAAHVGDDRGAAQKCSDYACVPLCATHHRTGPLAAHRLTGDYGREFWRVHGRSRDKIIATLQRRWAALRA